jgi:hypothetical protein
MACRPPSHRYIHASVRLDRSVLLDHADLHALTNAHEIGSFSVRLKCRFSVPACMISPRRAERRSRLAKDHRRRRREAVWTAASTARRLIRSGLPPRRCPFQRLLVAATSPFENLVSHLAKGLTAGRKSNAQAWAKALRVCRQETSVRQAGSGSDYKHHQHQLVPSSVNLTTPRRSNNASFRNLLKRHCQQFSIWRFVVQP